MHQGDSGNFGTQKHFKHEDFIGADIVDDAAAGASTRDEEQPSLGTRASADIGSEHQAGANDDTEDADARAAVVRSGSLNMHQGEQNQTLDNESPTDAEVTEDADDRAAVVRHAGPQLCPTTSSLTIRC